MPRWSKAWSRKPRGARRWAAPRGRLVASSIGTAPCKRSPMLMRAFWATAPPDPCASILGYLPADDVRVGTDDGRPVGVGRRREAGAPAHQPAGRGVEAGEAAGTDDFAAQDFAVRADLQAET